MEQSEVHTLPSQFENLAILNTSVHHSDSMREYKEKDSRSRF